MLSVQARTRTQLATAIVIGLLVAARFVLGSADLSLVAAALGFAVAAIGVDISTGYAGQPNFGQAAFMAIGAYVAAVLEFRLGLNFVAALVSAVVVCGLVATVLGFAAARLEHLGFGIVTFAFAFAVAALLNGDALAGLTSSS